MNWINQSRNSSDSPPIPREVLVALSFSTFCFGLVFAGEAIGEFVDKSSTWFKEIKIKVKGLNRLSSITVSISQIYFFAVQLLAHNASNALSIFQEYVAITTICFFLVLTIGFVLGTAISLLFELEIRSRNVLFDREKTTFRGADLTLANFTEAILIQADLSNAILAHTCWIRVRGMYFAHVKGTYLEDPKIMYLIVEREGMGLNFDYKRNLKNLDLHGVNVTCASFIGADLSGSNLVGANLTEAVFVRAVLDHANLAYANFSQANLMGADLSSANSEGASLKSTNLTKVQASGANFQDVHLTGACLEAWNIDSKTKLEGIDCQHVYLLRDQQERRPSSGNFAPGEFTKLFQEMLTTVDLIFRNGVDWKAFVSAFQQVQVKNEGTELTIQTIENKGDGVIVVRVNVPPEADKAKIHSEFTKNYEILAARLEEKERHVAFLEGVVNQLAGKHTTVKVNVKAESKAMTDSKDQSIQVGRDMNLSGSTLNLGEISGSVTNTINQLQTASPEAAQLADLLKQLQAAIEAEPALSDDDKALALEQTAKLAEAGKTPDETTKKPAKLAVGFLKGLVGALPDTTKLVEACAKLLPLITGLLGL